MCATFGSPPTTRIARSSFTHASASARLGLRWSSCGCRDRGSLSVPGAAPGGAPAPPALRRGSRPAAEATSPAVRRLMKRIPRDVSIQLFTPTPSGWRYLMLRRPPGRGGFWQSVTGAPLAGESDTEAAIREVQEETGYDVSASIVPLGVSYRYALRPELADRWEARYGRGVSEIS